MNVYYSPEKFGLEIIGEVEFSSGCYEFDTSVLWRNKATGAFYVANDSGCSCPTPFEEVGIDELKPIAKLQDLIDYFTERKGESYRYNPDDEFSTEDVSRIDGEIGELITKYRTAASAA